MLIAAKRIFTPDHQLVEGWIRIEDTVIAEVGLGKAPSCPDVTLDSGIVSPGFVDVHCHGGGGGTYSGTPDEVKEALRFHNAHGTTTRIGSLVTASVDDLALQVYVLAHFIDVGVLSGIHLEGPWLSAEHKGAHQEDLLCDPKIDDIDRLIEASNDGIRMVTIAPERPGALEAIRHLTDHGIVAAVGHTSATYEQTLAAIEAGARGTTHLFNAMPEVLHRAPGPALALWRNPDVYLELIFDGIHVAPDLLKSVMETKPDKCVLITDAMSAAGVCDGEYRLGALPVTVTDGIARISGTSTIAGSTLTLDSAVRHAVAGGVPVELTLRAATSNPADYLGLADVGRIAAGHRADLVVLDDDLTVQEVFTSGRVWRRDSVEEAERICGGESLDSHDPWSSHAHL